MLHKAVSPDGNSRRINCAPTDTLNTAQACLSGIEVQAASAFTLFLSSTLARLQYDAASTHFDAFFTAFFTAADVFFRATAA